MAKKLTVEEKTRRLMEEDASAVVHEVLECAFWLNELTVQTGYRRISDDTSGDIAVQFGPDGDAWIKVDSRVDPNEPFTTHRFRTYCGGGESDRVRNALLLLALAIKLDNESRPQHHRRKIDSENTDQ